MAEQHTDGRHVWIVNHHAVLPSKDGSEGRHLALARYLPLYNWSATLIVASTNHPSGEQRLSGAHLRRRGRELGVDTLWIRTNAYRSSSLLRLLGMGFFALNLLRPGATRGLQKPDVVIGSTVHLLAAWAGSRLARRHGVPFVFEIRDVWPDVLVDLGKVKSDSLFARSVRRLSVKLSRTAALVISPLPGVRSYLEANGLPDVPFEWISNGVDTVVEEATTTAHARESFTFMYLGSHNHSNAIEVILDAFDRASIARPDLDLRFRLVGGGPQKSALESMAAQLSSAQRVSFEPEIPRSAVLSRAREADCLVAALHDNRVYRYGISLNKLFDYLMAGRPVIFASNASNNPVQEAGAGPVVAADDPDALASAMIAIATESPEERSRLGANGMTHVREHYSYEVLSGLLARALNVSINPAPVGYPHAPTEGENVR